MNRVWSTFTAAPHRVMFLGGMVQLLLAMLWWGVVLAERLAGGRLLGDAVIYTTWAHAWLMLLGLFPFFMFGFLMTTYPRWMSGPAIPRRDYVGAFLFLTAGGAAFYPGLYAGGVMLVVALLLHLIGFGWALLALYRVYRQVGPARDRHYERQLNMALLCGVVADGAFLAWVAGADGRWLQAALAGALWLFLVPVLVLVAHRMIPFFSGSALPGYRAVQPGWSFPVLWCAAGFHFVLEMLDARAWFWLTDGPLLFLALHHSIHWQWRRALSIRLLGALHIAFMFLSLGLLLSVVQSLWLLATGELILWRAPLHAIGVGFIGGMTIAMVTRVSRGHSGRPLTMDWLDSVAFGAVVFAALLRIAAEFAPMAGATPPPLSVAAAVVWLLGLFPFAARYIPIYLRPRADGMPG